MRCLLSVICFIFIIQFFFTGSLQSQDTSNVKYLPLQVGNVWVYNFQYISMIGGGYGFDKYVLTGLIQYHGKTYYSVQHTHVQIAGNYNCYPRLFGGDVPIRMDSLSGNVYRAAMCSPSYEFLVDSLNAKLNNMSKSCFDSVRCVDTNIFNIFGADRKSKTFAMIFFESGNDETYAKNFGIVQYHYGFMGGSCYSSLRGCIINGVLYGDTSLTGINKISSEVPEIFSLSQNYPNPFNPITKIKFAVPSPTPLERAGVRLIIYDALGREVQTLVNEPLQPGTYEVDFDGSNFSSGVYYYTLNSSDFFETKKMLLIK